MFGRFGNSITNDRHVMDETAYKNVVSFLISTLDELCICYRITKNVAEKAKYDKVTVIIDKSLLNKVIDEFDYTGPYERHANTYSYLLDNKYQIDFVASDIKKFDIMSLLYSYDDFGWLIQRLLNKHDLYTLEQDGLYSKYHAHYKTYMIYLTDDIKTILGICQLEIDKYNCGFETYNDMFTYVSECPVFDKRLFDIDHLPKKVRSKFKNHILYKKLNRFMDKYSIDECMPGNLIYPSIMFKTEVNKAIAEIEFDYAAKKKLKSYFNGNIVNCITGIKHPKELGDFMRIIRLKYTDEELIADAVSIIKREYKERVM